MTHFLSSAPSELLPSAFCLDLGFLFDTQPFFPPLPAPQNKLCIRDEKQIFFIIAITFCSNLYFMLKTATRKQLTLARNIKGTLLTVAKAH